MAEKKEDKYQVIRNEWREFAKTSAYQDLIDYINLQKEVLTIMASGPMEVYKEVPTFDGKSMQELDFEPEKLAYLLQRSVGCDIVKTYVEDFTTT